ncbi:MAG: hypothetical protein ABW224_02150 [Kibdelosporangium sp.]
MQHSPAIHHTIVAVDIADFTNPARTELHQAAMHNGLYGVLESAFNSAGVRWDACRREDRGDGVLILVPSEFSKTLVVDQLPNLLVAGLSRYNAVHAREALIQLRMAVHSGEVYHDAEGKVSGELNNTYRFLDAEPAKTRLRETGGVLAMIVSDPFFRAVIAEDPATGPGYFQEIPVAVKHTKASAWLRILGTVSDESRVLPGFHESALHQLQELMPKVAVRGLAQLLAEAAGHGAPRLRRENDVWEAVEYLLDLNAEPDGFPRLMAFVELLAAQLGDTAIAASLREWNDAQAQHLRLGAALEERRIPKPTRDNAGQLLHLVIQIEHDGLDEDLFLVSHWRQDAPGHWPPARGEIKTAAFADLEAVIDEVILEAEEAWSEQHAEVALEFVLPRALLSLPVDTWRCEPLSDDPRPLVLDYPIVVRSLERMMARRWRRVWQAKWRALLEDPAAARVYIADSADLDKSYRMDVTLKDPQIVSLVLSEPPPRDVKPHDELTAAMRAGLPAVLWSRSEHDAGALAELIPHLVQPGDFLDLPQRVHEARQAALAAPDRQTYTEVIQNLVIMWDNPLRTLYLDLPPRSARLEGDTADERERAS